MQQLSIYESSGIISILQENKLHLVGKEEDLTKE